MFRTVLFDVDGVILSEERYFDASALTVWEMLFSPSYLGLEGNFTPDPAEGVIRRVRQEVFCQDKVLSFIKSRGINANWDMVYLAFAYQIIRFLEAAKETRRQEVVDLLYREIDRDSLAEMKRWEIAFSPSYGEFVEDFSQGNAEKQALLLDLNRIAGVRLGQEVASFSRNSKLWDICQEAFQEWYLGEEKFRQSTGNPPRQLGKKGFLYDEIPIISMADFSVMLQSMSSAGISLGIGTGRPHVETFEPLGALGIMPHFSPEKVVTASDVLMAERKHPERSPLAKPQPYCYIKALLGKGTPDEEVFAVDLPLKEGREILIVGDSVADFLAARNMGCKFAATLTGLSGKAARATFESLQADYILDDVLELQQVLELT